MVLVLLICGVSSAAVAPLDQPGPPLSISTRSLAAALSCPQPLVRGRLVVLLVAGTGATPEEQYSWNYEPALRAQGIAWCAVTIPDHLLLDDELSGEYMVYAIRTLFATSGRRIDIIGHSQGGMIPRWALRFWPDTRSMVDDLISLAGDNHGTAVINSAGICATTCVAAAWQQRPQANFIAALNNPAETFAGISYSDVYTRTDELSTPNASDHGTTSLHTGDGAIANIAIQSVCPGDLGEHVALGSIDPVGFALALDAIRHPGPADPRRIPASVCGQLVLPGADLTSPFEPGLVTGLLWLLSAATPLDLVGVPRLTHEPPLACYVTAACRGTDAPTLILRVSGRLYPGRRSRIHALVTVREGEALDPVAGVRVDLAGSHAITDASGAATLTVAPRRRGRYVISATRPGCNPAATRISIEK